MKPLRYKLSPKCHQILDLAGYELERVAYESSIKGWVIGNTRKFVALGLTVEEALKEGILEANRYDKLYDLCNKNTLIPFVWIDSILASEDLAKFTKFMAGQTASEYGFYSSDVRRFLEFLLTGKDNHFD